MNIIAPEINEYIMNISSAFPSCLPAESEIFADMEKYAASVDFPIIGPTVGRFLRQLVMLSGAKRIFEMGSGYGYSALWLTGGMPDDGRIICTDNSGKNRDKALGYFKQAGYLHKIDFRIGNAAEIIEQFAGPFDLIITDIDKTQYPLAFKLAIPRLRRGGLFISDNVLWSGQILNPEPDMQTQNIIEFNRKLFSSPEVISSIIPLRDGLGLAVKL